MRPTAIVLLLVVSLCACNGSPNDPHSPRRGRYQGIGTYPAGALWPHMVRADRPGDAAAATTDDDQQIIVVVDSETGEVRQCGNFSGYCIGMNPWAGPLRRGQSNPVSLGKHAADLEREADQAAGSTVAADPDGNLTR